MRRRSGSIWSPVKSRNRFLSDSAGIKEAGRCEEVFLTEFCFEVPATGLRPAAGVRSNSTMEKENDRDSSIQCS